MTVTDHNAEIAEVSIATSRPALGSNEPQMWAVVTMDDGSEVRMRSLGDRVEIRTWDHTESCNPPVLSVARIGDHVIDVLVLPPAGGGSNG